MSPDRFQTHVSPWSGFLPLVASLLLLAVLSATACSNGNGGGGDNAIDSYVASYLAAQRQANNALAYVPTPAFDGDDAITEAEGASIEANYAANVQLTRDFRNLVANITPPAEIEEEHTAFITALDAQLEYRAGFSDRYGQVRTLQELQALTAEVLDSDLGVERQESLDAACSALRNATSDAAQAIICGDE